MASYLMAVAALSVAGGHKQKNGSPAEEISEKKCSYLSE